MFFGLTPATGATMVLMRPGRAGGMVQKILGAVVGVVVAFVIVMVWQMLTHMIDPPPSDMNWRDATAVAEFMRAMPVWKYAVVILGYGLAAFAGGWLAALVARDRGWPTGVPAGALILGTFANVYSLPHPIWFPAVAILTILAGGWLSGRIGRRAA
jgi:chromate transport protein ChrA